MAYVKEIEELRKRGVRARHLRTFAELDSVCDDFLDGSKTGEKIQFLVLVGQMGVGKSHRFKNRDDIKYINTAGSVVGLYAAVWEAKADHENVMQGSPDDLPICLDDIDGLLGKAESPPFFKALCARFSDDYGKQVGWEKQNMVLEGAGIPKAFKTMSRVCLIFNELPKPKDRNLQAVFDRGRICFFDPTAKEVHTYVKKWWPKEHADIHRFVEDRLHRVYQPSIRLYEDLLEDKKLGHDWRKAGEEFLTGQDFALAAIAEMYVEDWFDSATQEQRAAEFEKRTGLKVGMFKIKYSEYRRAQGLQEGKKGPKPRKAS